MDWFKGKPTGSRGFYIFLHALASHHLQQPLQHHSSPSRKPTSWATGSASPTFPEPNLRGAALGVFMC